MLAYQINRGHQTQLRIYRLIYPYLNQFDARIRRIVLSRNFEMQATSNLALTSD